MSASARICMAASPRAHGKGLQTGFLGWTEIANCNPVKLQGTAWHCTGVCMMARQLCHRSVCALEQHGLPALVDLDRKALQRHRLGVRGASGRFVLVGQCSPCPGAAAASAVWPSWCRRQQQCTGSVVLGLVAGSDGHLRPLRFQRRGATCDGTT